MSEGVPLLDQIIDEQIRHMRNHDRVLRHCIMNPRTFARFGKQAPHAIRVGAVLAGPHGDITLHADTNAPCSSPEPYFIMTEFLEPLPPDPKKAPVGPALKHHENPWKNAHRRMRQCDGCGMSYTEPTPCCIKCEPDMWKTWHRSVLETEHEATCIVRDEYGDGVVVWDGHKFMKMRGQHLFYFMRATEHQTREDAVNDAMRLRKETSTLKVENSDLRREIERLKRKGTK